MLGRHGIEGAGHLPARGVFGGMGKSIRMMPSAEFNLGAPTPHSDEFPSRLFLDEMLSSSARFRFAGRTQFLAMLAQVRDHVLGKDNERLL